jgi:hypothetical protein
MELQAAAALPLEIVPDLRDVVPCSLVEVERRFRGAYYLHYESDYGGSKYL